MKIRNLAARAMVSMLLACLVTAFSATALALSGIDDPADGECTVSASFWDHNDYESLGLMSAMYFANNTKYSNCKKAIHLESDVTLNSPLVINISGSEAAPFVLDGGNKTLKIATGGLATSTDGLDGSVDGRPCGIYVMSRYVVIKNLTVEGTAGAEFNGICLMSAFGSLDNATSSGGKVGLVFGTNAASNRILPNSSIESAKEFGIDDKAGAAGTNLAIMTNRVGVANSPGETDKDGILDWDPDLYFTLDQLMSDFSNQDPTSGNAVDNEIRLAITGTERLLRSVSDSVPLITYIDFKGPTSRAQVKGMFVPSSGVTDANNDGEYDAVNCGSLTKANAIPQRLALFMVSSQGMQIKAVVGAESAKGIDKDDGTFDFYIDPAKNPDFFTQENKFVLVPVDASWELVGKASSYKRLSDAKGDCTDGTSPDNNGNNGGSGGASGLMEYDSLLECNADLEFQNGNFDISKDSDLDGIPDFMEMGVRKVSGVYKFDPVNADCSCNPDINLTCWYQPDTDRDGIKDGLDKYFTNNWSFYSDKDVVTELEEGQPINTDGDYTATPGASDTVADVRDTDSDNDGLLEGMEDRSRLFVKEDKAYFMYLETPLDPYYRDSDGDKVECTLSGSEKDIGIGFGIYKAGGTGANHIDTPLSYTMWDSKNLQGDQGIYPLACANVSAGFDSFAFNGSYDSSSTYGGETDARTPDTDGDCVCDGHGDGCKAINTASLFSSVLEGGSCIDAHLGEDIMGNPLWLDDGCPEKAEPTNECNPECAQGEVLKAVQLKAPEWVVEEAGQLSLKDEDGNNIPDLFEETVEETDADTGGTWSHPNYQLVVQSCSDIDKDNIPDCIERWDGLCTPTSSTDKVLDPYADDSDGDGLVDGMTNGEPKEDMCPFNFPAAGQSDDFTTTGTPNYSCDPLQVYTSGNVAKMLSCFLDRDADGVRDCLEDKDMDGVLDPPVSGITGIVQSESNILDVDTDDDALDDHAETSSGYKTNPQKADTDDDGLWDGKLDENGDDILIEDRNKDDAFVPSADMTGQGCEAGIGKDTDPRKADTDGDGLSDKMEVAGPIIDKDNFYALILDNTVWGEGGIPHGSNPLAKDSDGDSLDDNQEYSGSVIMYYDSNPCLQDSDGDSKWDDDEQYGCQLNPAVNCEGSDTKATGGGVDSDGDGLSDLAEAMLGTDPNDFDSDDDGVKDGDEDTNHDGIYEPNLGETNANLADTDADGLNDGFELRYGTDPTIIDTDGDCIPDGPMTITDRLTGTQIQSTGEDANQNGQYDMGSETYALSSDTDEDGLPDGWVASSGMGEDLNCSGVREIDAATGRYTETDPRNPDSDMDGYGDLEEMTNGGYFNIANLERSTTGREGCSIAGVATGAAPTSMFYLMLGLMAAVKGLSRKLRKTPA